MAEWIAAARTAKKPAALVTILATEGSAPRGPGARMVVTADASHGTIGGGALEWRATEQARSILAHPPGAWRIQDYPLGPLLGQCCGGRVRVLVEHLADHAWIGAMTTGNRVLAMIGQDQVHRSVAIDDIAGNEVVLSARGPLPTIGARFVEPHDESRRPLMLFGAGHVGSAIATRIAGLPFDLAWFDNRAEASATGVMVQDQESLVACAAEAPVGAAVLVMTHDHALDYRLCSAALKSPATFVGLIGSATKRARFLSRFAMENVDATRLVCPIGVADIAGKQPAVIAIAVLAQLLSLEAVA